MRNLNEVHVHIHIHEGTSPEAARAAVEAFRPPAGATVSEPVAEGGDGSAPGSDRVTEYVRRAYTESRGNAKPLLEFLAANPERLIPYPEVSAHLGFDSARSLPGLLGAFSRRADHRYEGVQPFERRQTLDGWCLQMSKENAEIINSLRA